MCGFILTLKSADVTLRKERSPSTPLETTLTEAMDTEEAQEFGKEIVAKATQRELKKQEYIGYQQR